MLVIMPEAEVVLCKRTYKLGVVYFVRELTVFEWRVDRCVCRGWG